MAFNLSNFVQDQVDVVEKTLSPTNVLDKVTPTQVKQILNAKPKNAINDSLGELSGVKLGQFFSETGKQFSAQVNTFIESSKAQLEAQVFGCINKSIKDILNKNPLLEKVLFFDQFINRELSNIKNKLESKIDFELRKIAYKKIKVHQVVLFKQKIALSIKSICPDATPATPSQVRKYKELINKAKNNFINEGVVQEEAKGNNLVRDQINKVVTFVDDTQEKIAKSDISTTVKRKLKQDPVQLEKYKEESVTNAVNSIVEQANKQIESLKFESWEELYG